MVKFGIGRWVGVALLLGALAACDSAEERVEKHFSRGLALAEQGETAKARIEFRNALRLNQDHGPSRFELGKLAEEEGNFRVAYANYARAAENDPSHLEARLKLAQFALAGGALDEARRYAEEAYALAPGDAETLATRAAVLYRLDDVGRALDAARAALALDPAATTAHLVLVTHLADSEGPAAAVAYLDRLLEQRSDDVTLNLVKLRLLAASEDMEGVERHLVTLVERFPDEVQFPQALAQLYGQRGDLDAAEAQLRAVADGRPADVKAALSLTRFLLAARGEAAALGEIASRAPAAPQPVRTALRIAQSDIEFGAGRLDDARATLETVAAEPGEDAHAAIVQLARLEIAGGDLAAAKARIDALLERDPDNVDALAARAVVQIEQYRPEDAILTLRRALNLAPQNAQLLLIEARAHDRNGNPTLAGERLASAARQSEFAPEIALRYAAFLRSRDQAVAAEGVLSESARRHPGARDVLTALAEVRLALGDTAGAAALAERLRAVDKGAIVADQIVAATLAAEGRLAESVSVLERAVATPGTGEGALATLVSAYIQQGERERAVALLDELLTDNPANVRAAVLRAELHVLANESPQALALLERLAADAPADATPHVVLARLHIAQGDPVSAERAARRGIERAADTRSLRFLLAGLLEQRAAFDEAIEVYTSLYGEDPESAVVANNLASLLAEHRENDPESVAEAARIARRLRGSDVPYFQDTYGWIAFLTGDLNEALRTLSTAAEKLPNNALVRYHFGRALIEAGQFDRGRREIEAALAIDPSFPKAVSARAALDALAAKQG